MLYMQSVGERTRSKSAVEEVYNALAWAHRIGDQQSPTESTAVKFTLQGLQRQLAKPIQKKSRLQLKFWLQLSQMLRNPTHWLIFVWRQLAC